MLSEDSWELAMRLRTSQLLAYTRKPTLGIHKEEIQHGRAAGDIGGRRRSIRPSVVLWGSDLEDQVYCCPSQAPTARAPYPIGRRRRRMGPIDVSIQYPNPKFMQYLAQAAVNEGILTRPLTKAS